MGELCPYVNEEATIHIGTSSLLTFCYPLMTTNNGCKGTQIFSYLQIFCEQFAKNLHFCPFSCDLSDFLHRIGELYSRTNCERLYASFCTLRERLKRTSEHFRTGRAHFFGVFCFLVFSFCIV